MFSVSSDTTKNRLYITLGDLTPEAVNPILAQLNKNIATLKAGFTCLVDIRDMVWEKGVKGEEYVEIIQGALTDSGMGKVVRVINKSVQLHERMEDSSRYLGYTATPVYTREKAEEILDEG